MSRQHEPSFYMDALNPAFNSTDREHTIMRDGVPVRVKHPQGAHSGTSIDDMTRLPSQGVRYWIVVKNDGNEVYHPLTSSASDTDVDGPYAQQRKRKARFYGWYRKQECPVALLSTGQMHRDHFVDQALLNATPCEHGSYSLRSPCPHALAEQTARRAANEVTQAKYHEPGAAEKMLAAQSKHTTDIVEALRDVMAPVAALAAKGAKGTAKE